MNINFDYPFKSRDDFLKDVVKSLIDRRKELGLTQDELNYRLGVSDRLLSKWECGTRSPTSFHLYCWADALKSKLIIISNDNTSQSIADVIETVSNENKKTPSWEEVMNSVKSRK